jgi:hypothetical protein
VRLRQVTGWIATTARRRRAAAGGTLGARAPLPTAPPPDADKIAAVGEVLHACYPDRDEPLDDHLTALMLQLTIERAAPPPRR